MTFERAWVDLVAGWYPGDPFQPNDAVEEYYRTKWRIARELQPGTILEIGVRAGYSAFVFMRAAPRGSRYLGIDNGLCDVEARREYLAHAARLLKGMDVRFWFVDTGSLRTFPVGPDGDSWDLIHVDGHHSYEGCLHDVGCAARVGRRILVDDYDTSEEIRRACAEFLRMVEPRRWASREIHDGGLAGNLLLERRG